MITPGVYRATPGTIRTLESCAPDTSGSAQYTTLVCTHILEILGPGNGLNNLFVLPLGLDRRSWLFARLLGASAGRFLALHIPSQCARL